MALIIPVRGLTPAFGEDCFLAANATVTGDVIMGNNCSVWFNAVLRGDVNSIRVGNMVNIQDNSMVHCTFEKTTVKIGNNVSIGHNVIIHGADIEDNVLVGMGAILMDNVVVGTGSVIAAGALVTEGTVVEPYSVYAGVPAKFMKKANREKHLEMIERIARNYIRYAGWYRK
jgi:carbonic anhydrase/acetyltransferase-like protein (isoleucine patch superfamily)